MYLLTFFSVYRVPKDIGEDLQSLTVIGTPIAWLFALPTNENPQSQNGFTITGGVFNYTAEIKFPESIDHSAKITMQFQGSDVVGYPKPEKKTQLFFVPELNPTRLLATFVPKNLNPWGTLQK